MATLRPFVGMPRQALVRRGRSKPRTMEVNALFRWAKAVVFSLSPR
jgi:hypothetical protein